ncbi:MAG: cupin domain-containing protein [Flavobacteriales bacterium]
MKTAKEVIEQLRLLSHPEGGYFKEMYRSKESVDVGFGPRSASTCIYFLLTSDAFSAFHRIKQDEFWFFHQGSPIRLHTISPTGQHTEHLIGLEISKGQVPQLCVKGGDWFAAEVIESSSWSLVSCTVAPGFDFADFELAERNELIHQFPQHKDVIHGLTR